MKGWIIGLTVGGVALAGIVVAGLMESTPAAAQGMTTLQPGHRYNLQAGCPFPIPGLPLASAPMSDIVNLIGIPGMTAVSYMPAADGKSFTLVFDYTGSPLSVPPIQAGGGTACTTAVTDMGNSPVGGVVPEQAVAVFWGKTGSAKASASMLTVAAPGDIVRVDPDPAIKSSTLGPNKNQARVMLSGQPGKVVVYGSAAQPWIKAMSATVLVS